MNHDHLRKLLHQGVDQCCASLPLDPDRVGKVLRAVEEEERRARLSRERRRGSCLRGWRMPVAVALGLLVLFAGLALPHGWLRTYQYDDGEQYLITGHNLPDSRHAIAAPGIAYGVYVPATWEEVLDLFAFPPLAPQWMPEGWQVELYNVSLLETSAALTIVYANEDSGGRLIWDFSRYADYSSIHQYVEQDGEGVTYVLPGGQQIYLTSNAGRQTASWFIGTTTCLISGDITPEELLKIAESVR